MWCFLISTLERELEELEASALAAAAEDQRMRELCGEYSGEHHDGHDDDDDGDDHEDDDDDDGDHLPTSRRRTAEEGR